MKLKALVVALLAAAGGWWAALVCHHFPEPAVKVADEEIRPPGLFRCPMHRWFNADQPGQCTLCGMDLMPVNNGGTNLERTAHNLVLLPPGSPNVLGVQTAMVKKQPLVRTLRVAGMIGEDESHHGIISAPVEGRIDGLAMSCEGDQITRRQPLITIFSRTLLAAANDYKTALVKSDAAAVTNAQRCLEQYGLVWEQIKAIPQRQDDDIHFGILAPLSGTIVKSYVSEGQHVKEGEKLFEIADFTTMWFTFTAYEPDLPFIQVDQIVELSTPSLPGQTVKARVTFINPNLDDQTHAATVRVLLEHPELHLKNKSQADGLVQLDAPEVLAVPRTAVLWPGNAPRVYVEKSPGIYEQRDVKLGRLGDAFYELLEGLTEGEHVVTSGNLLIDGQAQLNRHASPP